MTIMDKNPAHGNPEIDLKRYVRVEKVGELAGSVVQIPGGELSESRVLKGVMLNKDVTHSSMRRHIDHPRIILLTNP